MRVPQMAIYIDDQLAKRLEKAVKASGKSKSRWVAEAIERSLQDQWSEGFFLSLPEAGKKMSSRTRL